MARDIAEAVPRAREIVERADRILERPLSRLMFEGPDGELTLTVNAQPALFVASVAALTALQPLSGLDYVAGHSVGEYAALVAAEAMTFEDALRLVQTRGELMHQ